jgi:hypothetical protein
VAPGPARAAKYQKIRIDQAPVGGSRASEPGSAPTGSGAGALAARILVTVIPAGPPPQADSEAAVSDLESHPLEDQEVTVSPGQGQDRDSDDELEEPGQK